MGWMDAPEVEGGAAWQAAPVAEDVIATTKDGGRIVRSQSGSLSFVSPSFSTNDPAIIAKIMEGASPAQEAKSGMRREIISAAPVAARAIKALEGVPFVGSYLDEIIGAMAGPEARQGVRAVSGAMQEEYPGQSLALGVGGGLLGTGAMVAAAPAGTLSAIAGPGAMRTVPSMARGLAAGAAGGAVEGGIYGSGLGEDAASRASSAGTGAAVGGLLGGALGGVMPLVQKGASNLAGYINRSDVAKIAADLGISQDAAAVIRNTFSQGGDIQAARDALMKAGDEAMLADAGYAAQALLDAAAASGGQATSVARTAIEDRMTRTGAALDASLDTALGPAPFGPKTAVAEIAAKSAPARELAYRTAYDTPINYAAPEGMAIEETLARIAPDDLIAGIVEANKEMLARGEVNQQIMAVLGPDGRVEFLREMPNVRQLDEIKKALQSMAYSRANTDDFGRLTDTGQMYADLARQVRDATANAVPSYGAAVQIGGDKLAEERAFSLGRDLLRPQTEIEDVGLELGKKPSQDQIAAAKSGLRSFIAKTLGDVRALPSDPNMDARQVVKAVTDLSSDNARAKIRELMGKEADALLAEIDKAAQSAVVRSAMAVNSKTAIRGSVQRGVEEQIAPGMVGNLMAGEPVNTSKALIQAVTGQTREYTEMQRQRVYAEIAKALTEKRGKSAVAALNYLEAAMNGQPLTAAQNEFVAQQIAASGLLGGMVAAQEATGR